MDFHNWASPRSTVRSLLLILTGSIFLLSASAQASDHAHDKAGAKDARFVSHMQHKIQALRSGSSMHTAGERLRNRHVLVRTYDRTGYQPLWLNANGWQRNAQGMLNYLTDLPRHGLDPSNYHFAKLKTLRNDTTLAGRIHADLLLSDAFVSLVTDLSRGASGRGNHGSHAQSLLLRLKPTDDPAREFDGLLPKHPEYWALSQALHHILSDAEHTQHAPLVADRLIKPDQQHPMIPALRTRLKDSGDYTGTLANNTDNLNYDAALAAAVARFQARNGLNSDALIGPSTLGALNRTRLEVIDTISLNLERWRQQPASYGDSYVRVNIASQMLEYRHEQQPPLRMKVIVGRPDRQTPTTSSEINEVVFNPDWTVPPRIAAVDKLPLIKRDPDYLKQRGYTLSAGWSRDAPQVDPDSVDWSQINRNNFPFVLRQQPGPQNALGQVKFLFPNPYSVYLHDTPSRSLFERDQRMFSSGCIRVGEPMVLARALLRDHAGSAWTDVAQISDTHSVRLDTRVPVHLQYWTAWVAEDGSLQVRTDVYQRDHTTLNALRDSGAYQSSAQLVALYQSERATQLAALSN